MTVHAALRCDLCGKAFTVDYDPARAVSVNEVRRWAKGNGWHSTKQWSWVYFRRIELDICASPDHVINWRNDE